jgi:acetolactate synthase-1/2/3 large subunit
MICGDQICAALKRAGIDTVFGVPGTQSVSFFECLRRSSLRTVLTTSEFSATQMANGYYRSSGRTAATISIEGPGLTLATTGLLEALHDSAALLHILTRHPKEKTKSFGLQDVENAGLAKILCKDRRSLDRPEQAAQVITEACRLAKSDEPGPVLLELTHDVVETEVSGARPLADELTALHEEFESDKLDEVVRAIVESSRVCLMLGQGAAASGALQLAETLRAPVISTCSGRGIIPDDHRLAVACDFGSWGIETVNRLIRQADLVLAIGCKFSHNGSGGYRLELPAAKLIHIDTSAQVLGANYPASITIRGDATLVVERMLNALRRGSRYSSKWSDGEISDWKESHKRAQREAMLRLPIEFDGDGHAVERFMATLRELLSDSAVIVTDSGLHQILVRVGFRIRRARGLVVPSDLQSMGYGVPAAIGAKLANPENEVVLVVGDGGMLLSGLELLTAVREKLKLTVILLNDHSLGQIRLQQLQRYGHAFATSSGDVSFRRLAEAVGADYLRVGSDYRAALSQCLSNNRVTLAEVAVNDPGWLKRDRMKAAVKQIGAAMGGRKLKRLASTLLRKEDSE